MRMPSPAGGSRRSKPRFTRLGVAAFFAIIAFWTWAFWPKVSNDPRERARDARQAAYDQKQEDDARALTSEIEDVRSSCQQAIRARLKAPTSATFEGIVTRVKSRDSSKIYVTGRVTAVNSFNAPLTMRFVCTYDRAKQFLTPYLEE